MIIFLKQRDIFGFFLGGLGAPPRLSRLNSQDFSVFCVSKLSLCYFSYMYIKNMYVSYIYSSSSKIITLFSCIKTKAKSKVVSIPIFLHTSSITSLQVLYFVAYFTCTFNYYDNNFTCTLNVIGLPNILFYFNL
jgi:hypothetical protein